MDKFWIDRGCGRPALYEIEDYSSILRPEDGEQFVAVELRSRYYGVGYEHGDLPVIVGVAAWLERRIRAENRSAEVWYGGDSSERRPSRFGGQERRALFDHFVAIRHGRPVNHVSGHCTFCDEPIYAFKCDGCGYCQRTGNLTDEELVKLRLTPKTNDSGKPS